MNCSEAVQLRVDPELGTYFCFFKGVEPFIKPLDKDTLSKLCEESCEGPQDVCQASSFKNLMTHPGLWNAGRCKHLLRPVLQILSFSSTWRCHVLWSTTTVLLHRRRYF